MLEPLQNLVILLLAVAIFIFQIVALVDLLRRPASAFTIEGKLTKVKWGAILAIAAVIGFVGLPYPLGRGSLGFLGMIAVVPAIVYLVDVRPAVARHGRSKGSGGGPQRPSGW